MSRLALRIALGAGIGAALALAWRVRSARAGESTRGSSSTPRPSSKGAPPPPAAPSPASSSSVYRTPLSSVVVPPWAPMPGASGRELAGPVLSTDGVTRYARLSYRDALELAAREGARLPTEAEARAWHAAAASAGALPPPCVLPGAASEELARLHRERGWSPPRSGDPRMASAEWARAHDECAATRQRGEYGSANAGKLWLAGAKPGRAINFGWLEPTTGRYIQTAGGAHDDSHADYSQLTWLVREVRA